MISIGYFQIEKDNDDFVIYRDNLKQAIVKRNDIIKLKSMSNDTIVELVLEYKRIKREDKLKDLI